MPKLKQMKADLKRVRKALEKEIERFDKQADRYRGTTLDPVLRGYLAQMADRRKAAAESMEHIKQALGELTNEGDGEAD